MDEERWIARTLERLSHSAFRAKFELAAKDRAYARAKGRDVIDRHAHEMLRSRVGDAEPRNDGRQTPWRGHPVFTAQHATATCCRGCIATWHHIPKGRELTDAEVDWLAALVMAWIERDLARHPVSAVPWDGTVGRHTRAAVRGAAASGVGGSDTGNDVGAAEDGAGGEDGTVGGGAAAGGAAGAGVAVNGMLF